MKRRICLAGVALSVCPLAFLTVSAAAASKKTKTPTKTPIHKVSCTTKTSIVIANGDTNVLPPASSGAEYGLTGCGSILGSGVQKDSFNMADSGDTLAKFGMYFNAGTVHGTYDLTPQPGSLNFLETDWTGTMKILGGTGAYKGDKGTGTMTCKSPDGIHTTCTDKIKLKNA